MELEEHHRQFFADLAKLFGRYAALLDEDGIVLFRDLLLKDCKPGTCAEPPNDSCEVTESYKLVEISESMDGTDVVIAQKVVRTEEELETITVEVEYDEEDPSEKD